MIVVSSCIAGSKCRYNGTDSYSPSVMESVVGKYVAVCPEILAGFGVPRAACEIVGGDGEDVIKGTARVIDRNNIDITDKLLRGAEAALQICVEKGVTEAYLKSKSPSCGFGIIYDGSFSSTVRPGNGIFAALLNRQGIKVFEVI